MEEYGGEPDARLGQGLHDPGRDRPRGGRHLRAPRDPGEDRPVHVHGPGVRVSVVNRSALLRGDRLEGRVCEREPQAGETGVLGEETDFRGPDLQLVAGSDGERPRLTGVPAGLRDPEVGAEPRAQVQEDVAEAPLRGEAPRDRRALVHDEEVPRTEELREILKAGMVVAIGEGDEKPHVVPPPAPLLGRDPREQALGSIEDEFGSPHAGTSQTSAWARYRPPVTDIGGWERSHAQNGSVTSGSGRSEMSSPGKASWCIFVRMSPGSTLTMPTPSFLSSTARAFEIRSSAALLAPYTPHPGYPATAAPLVMFTTSPWERIRRGRASWTRARGASTLTSNTR